LKVLYLLIDQHTTLPDATSAADFQDRCLKPLGHPSGPKDQAVSDNPKVSVLAMPGAEPTGLPARHPVRLLRGRFFGRPAPVLPPGL
jgi:hypothetical protein